MTYDIVCPICGKKNRSLYLEETNGWMECEHCGNSTQDLRFQRTIKVPVFWMDQVSEIMPLKLGTATAQ